MKSASLDREPEVPRLSIVISTLNAARTLPRCLESIHAQTFSSFEVVVIDGASTDATALIASEFSTVIRHFQSGPDSGIYDAWNKALALVRTEWTCFLGADDKFTMPTSLQQFAELADYPAVNLVSARVDMTNASGTVLRVSGEPWNKDRMHRYMCVAHPGAWHHRSLFDAHGKFSLEYRLAGDYEFLLRAGEDIREAFVDKSLVTMELGGVSNRSYWRHVKENFAVLRRQPQNGSYYATRFALRAVVGRLARFLGLKSHARR